MERRNGEGLFEVARSDEDQERKWQQEMKRKNRWREVLVHFAGYALYQSPSLDCINI
jgi:hypothetical protein